MRISAFLNIERHLERINRVLDRAALFPILDKIGKLTILIAIISTAWTYQSEKQERIKAKHLQAWQVIAAAEGKGGSGGRIEALQDLVEDKVWLLGVNLSGAMIDSAVLTGAEMHKANLRGAFLQNVELTGANLFEADLTDAVLRHAQLSKTCFMFADASRAQFVSANLSGANFSAADLTGADFRGAQLTGTDFFRANLRSANFAEAHDLTCEQLAHAYNWESAYRDPELACGRDIPKGEFKSHTEKEFDKFDRFNPERTAKSPAK